MNISPEAYAKLHQQAFRTAFDFLKEHFPPENTAEFWEKTANDASEIGKKCIDNSLAIELMGSVLSYLSEISERRHEHEQPCN